MECLQVSLAKQVRKQVSKISISQIYQVSNISKFKMIAAAPAHARTLARPPARTHARTYVKSVVFEWNA